MSMVSEFGAALVRSPVAGFTFGVCIIVAVFCGYLFVADEEQTKSQDRRNLILTWVSVVVAVICLIYLLRN